MCACRTAQISSGAEYSDCPALMRTLCTSHVRSMPHTSILILTEQRRLCRTDSRVAMTGTGNYEWVLFLGSCHLNDSNTCSFYCVRCRDVMIRVRVKTALGFPRSPMCNFLMPTAQSTTHMEQHQYISSQPDGKTP